MECIKGDIFNFLKDNKYKKFILPHCCNDLGAWGGGFTYPLEMNYPFAAQEYRKLTKKELIGGATQLVQINEYLVIANMIGQKGLISSKNPTPVKYPWIEKCMETVANEAIDTKAEIVTIPFGCGLAGGSWKIIKGLIKTIWEDFGIKVTVFDNQKISVFDEK